MTPMTSTTQGVDMDRRIVCAAIRNKTGGIICAPRHFDPVMHAQIVAGEIHAWYGVEQGFVDQNGEFLTRAEAFTVAKAAGQIIHRCGGDDGCLFSENLY